MGIFDKLRDLKLFKKAQAVPQREQIVLRWSEHREWPTLLAEHASIASTFREHTERISRLRDELERAAKALTSEQSLQKIPERARTTNAVHGSEYAAQLRKVLEKSKFTTPEAFEDEHDAFTGALDAFKQATTKSATALGEYMGPQLDRAHSLIATLEDEVLKLLEQLEEKKNSELTRLQRAQQALDDFEAQQGKFKELQEALVQEQHAAQEKAEQIKQKIAEQRALIRNPTAQHALEQLATIEQELDTLIAPYEAACKDAKKYYAKATFLPPKEAAVVIDRLPKDPVRYALENTAQVRDALEQIAEQIEQEGTGRIGQLPGRLHALAGQLEQDVARMREIVPEQAKLRKDIIRDVAALNIYDQQQFLLRAEREDREIGAKIAYVEDQLSGSRRIALEREIKDAAIALGAVIAGEEASVPAQGEGSAQGEQDAPQDDLPDLEDSDEQEPIADDDAELSNAQQDAERSVGDAESLLKDVEEELRSAQN